MANIAVNPTHTNTTASHAQGVLADLMTRFMQYRMYRKTLAELSTLNERELTDLGLSRAQLRRAAYQAAYE
ncbi:DUF1127 domain-containing protein [Roseobacteraceae bacterium S113]